MELAFDESFCEMSFTELMTLDGGAWSWGAFAKASIGGAAGGAVGGAAAGLLAGGVGAGPGALAGGVAGGIGGAVTYALVGWW